MSSRPTLFMTLTLLSVLTAVCLDAAAADSGFIEGKASKNQLPDKLNRPLINTASAKPGYSEKKSTKLDASDWNSSFKSSTGSFDQTKLNSGAMAVPPKTDASFSSSAKSNPNPNLLNDLFESDKMRGAKKKLSLSLTADEIKMLETYEITVLIDCSDSMHMEDCQSAEWAGNAISRWDWCKEETSVLSRTLNSALPGINIITFSDHTQWYRNVPTKEINRIFDYNRPHGSTALHMALDDAIRNYDSNNSFVGKRKKLLIAVITDGMPDEPWKVARVIDGISKDANVSTVFFLIGADFNGSSFIERLHMTHPDAVQVHFYDEVCQSGLAPILVQSIRSANLAQMAQENATQKKDVPKPFAKPFK